MPINLYDVYDAQRRAVANAAYISSAGFPALEREAENLGYRHATLGEIEASADSAQRAPELFSWRGGLWVKLPPEEFTCRFCGAPSHVDPSDQAAPADYCHPADHMADGT